MASRAVVRRDGLRGSLSRSGLAVRRAVTSLVGEKGLDASMGQGVGWRPYMGGPQPRTGPRVSSLLDVFGGTDSSVGWVYACVDHIATELGGYPWQTVQNWRMKNERPKDPPEELHDLLLDPSPEHTYDDWIYLITADLELVGNSYWLKDMRDGFGRPQELFRLRPDLVQIVTNEFDRKVGYVYLVNGQMIPFTLDMVMHYKYPNPRNAHYGMGTLEAVIRAVDEELAESAHVTGFFRQGAHLSGVLTVPDTLGEEEFKRLVKQYEEQFAESSGSFRVLIAESSSDFKTISGTPAAIGVVDLRRLTKDEILTGFGMPEEVLGGIHAAAGQSLDQAQLVVARKLKPKAKRIASRTSSDLTRLWDDLGFRMMAEQAEPESVKIKRGRELLGAGATLNESRETAGQQRLTRADADEPLVPGGLMPLRDVVARSGRNPRPRDLPNVGPDEPHLVGAPSPNGGQLPTRSAKGMPAAEQMILEGHRLLMEEMGQELTREFLHGKSTGGMPALPAGFEDWSGWEHRDLGRLAKLLHTSTFDQVVQDKARFLHQAVPELQSRVVALFLEQRRHVLELLRQTRSITPRAAGQHYGGKAPRIEDLWNDADEAERLDSLLTVASEALLSMTAFEGFEPSEVDVRVIVDQAVEEMGQGVNDVTRDKIREQVEEGLRRHYPIDRIANGYPAEDYPGVVGVFDDATTARAGVISRTGSATLYNLAHVRALEMEGEEELGVMDGIGDEGCRSVNGTIQTLEWARAHALEHPNCVRTFFPVGTEG